MTIFLAAPFFWLIAYIPAHILAALLRSLEIIQRRDQQLWAETLTIFGAIALAWYLFHAEEKTRRERAARITGTSKLN